MNILVASTINHPPYIVKNFLESLKNLNCEQGSLSYYLIDDNYLEESSNLITKFKEECENVTVINSKKKSEYIIDEFCHRHTEEIINTIVCFKNNILDYAFKNQFDYVFIIDSDIIATPDTICNLIKTKKDIIFNIFYTKWTPNLDYLPQVWEENKLKTENFSSIQCPEFLYKLSKPGIYKCEGLPSCVLISNNALSNKIKFEKINDVSIWEDLRCFCMLNTNGYDSYVYTKHPLFHIYRQSELDNFKNNKSHINLEIQAHKLFDFIKNTVSKLESYSYKEDLLNTNFSGICDSLSNKYKNYFNCNCNYIIDNKITRLANVTDCDIVFNKNSTSVYANIRLNICGYKNYETYVEKYDCVCMLSKLNDFEYIINDFRYLNKISSTNLPIIRRIYEENSLTLSMVVNDYNKKFFKNTLSNIVKYLDSLVLIDTTTTDEIQNSLNNILKDIPYKYVKIEEKFINNEKHIRTVQWTETIKIDPDWILFIDSGEIFEDTFKTNISSILNKKNVDIYMFKLYTMYNDKFYRQDYYVNPDKSYGPYLLRYNPKFNYKLTNSENVIPRLPINLDKFKITLSDIRLKFYGLSTLEDRKIYYEKYSQLKNCEFLLDEDVNLVEF